MTTERKPLDFGDLDDFQPRAKDEKSKPKDAERKAIDQVAAFPSRERDDDGQMNIKGSEAILRRFRDMAKAERYKHGEFLEILMNAYEQKQK